MDTPTGFLWDEDDHTTRVHGTEAVNERPRQPGLPAEPGLWLFVLGDMTVFGWFFLVFCWERRKETEGFAQSASELHLNFGVINTFVLLCSSLFVLLGLHAHRVKQFSLARSWVGGAIFCAAAFAALKAVEYWLVIADGHTPQQAKFFLFYFAFTGIHLFHVLVGAALLGGWVRMTYRRRTWDRDRLFVESAAVYWHMVDLLWIVIFTLVYLVGAQ